MDAEPSQKKPLSRRIQEKLAASRFFTFSALLHVILVVMGGSVVLFRQATEAPDFTSSGDILSGEVSVTPPQEQPQTPTEQTFTPETPSISAPLTAITTTSTTNTAFQMAAIPVAVRTMPTDLTKKMTDTKPMGKGLAPGLPGTMTGRKGGSARMELMKKNKMEDKSEKAVMAGLRWLMKTQNSDGSWSDQHKPAMTGLALLCFLGHGETAESPEFGPTVSRALEWVLAGGTEFQGRLSLQKEFNQPGVYEHGILTYAVAEYYTMTKDERFAELVKQAAGYIVQGQGPDGGWMYGYDKSQGDTSVSGWQIQALKAAHLTGLGIAGVDEALEKAMLNLKRVQSENGNFGYRKANDRGNNPSLVGVGVLCTLFWRQEKDKVSRDGMEFLLKMAESEHPVIYKGDKADLYAWYYNTQACLMYGGTPWTKWNRMFQDEIADAQRADGSWPPNGGKGHRENEPGIMGDTYRTTLCILMLEVFYRYMPTNK